MPSPAALHPPAAAPSQAARRLHGWFARGTHLRPGAGAPSTVDLAHALASLADAPVPLGVAARRVADAIGRCEHLVFVVVDGLGQSMVERRAAGGFFRRAWRMELSSVFPSATAAALTSLSTGLWPNEHAVPGWWTYLPDRDLTVTTLPCVERWSGASFESLGIPVEAVFGAPPLMPRFGRDVASFLPAWMADSMYSRYWRGGTPTRGWTTFAGGVDLVLERVTAARRAGRGPTYSHLYTPVVDAVAHAHGPQSVAVHEAIAEVERELERLADGLAGLATVAVTADHGLVEVPEGRKHLLLPGDPLSRLLRLPPTGEPRTPLLHVRPGEQGRLRDLFEARFGEAWALLDLDEVEALELLGPGPIPPLARGRAGDFVAVAEGPDVLLARPGAGADGTERLIGYHGGLLPDEVRIPLIVS